MPSAPDRLPGWPIRMKVDLAAAYVGMSRSSFEKAIQSGEMPAGAKLTGGTYWLRADLERAVEQASAAGDFGEAV